MGKGRKERLVPFGRKTRKAIVAYATDERPDAHRDEAVFVSSFGNRLNPDSLRQLMRRLRVSSGISRLHPHLLRHTFATRFLLNGGDALMLKHILGHTTLAMTDRYVHFANAQGVTASRAFSPIDRHADAAARQPGVSIQGLYSGAWPNAIRRP
ncbi:MAG: tyrosine-type recombinase/integrase [Chloroflexi bacterium]|nr:tyrosine-type recombinase/integrase [Chloroflexota bacterium]